MRLLKYRSSARDTLIIDLAIRLFKVIIYHDLNIALLKIPTQLLTHTNMRY